MMGPAPRAPRTSPAVRLRPDGARTSNMRSADRHWSRPSWGDITAEASGFEVHCRSGLR